MPSSRYIYLYYIYTQNHIKGQALVRDTLVREARKQ